MPGPITPGFNVPLARYQMRQIQCPYCDAPPAQTCKRESGVRAQFYHDQRWDAYNAEMAEGGQRAVEWRRQNDFLKGETHAIP